MIHSAFFWINQVKSATDNNGLFSTENDDIQMAVGDNLKNSSNFAQNKENYDLRSRNRQVLSERFSPEELKGCNGILEEAEALLQRGSESSVPEKQKEVTGDPRLARRQEAVLENWAKEKGIWIDNTTDSLNSQYGEPFASEGEANVYLSQDGKTAVKEISMAYYIEPHLMLDRIVLHNAISPNTSLTLTHLGRSKYGEFVVIVEQPFVEGTTVSQKEIMKFMADIGFKPYNRRNTEFINEEAGILINDLHDENVIKDKNGFYHIIDGDFRINTANYGLGGRRTTKSLSSQQPSELPFYLLKTPKKEVEIYGFIDPKTREMYLDDAIIRPEHPIHEYIHFGD